MAEIHARRGALRAGARHLPAHGGDLRRAGVLAQGDDRLQERPQADARAAARARAAGRDLPAAGHGGGRAARAASWRPTSCSRRARSTEALPALRKIVGLHPDNIASRIRLAETASQVGAGRRGGPRAAAAGGAAEGAGARATSSCASPSGCCSTGPTTSRVARELAAAYIARRNPRLALAKLQGALKAAPRDPQNVTLLARGAGAARSAQGGVGLARAGRAARRRRARSSERDAAMRAALALDPTDGETRELAARWGVARQRRSRAASSWPPPPLPVGRQRRARAACRGARSAVPAARIDSGPVSGLPGRFAACPAAGTSALTPGPTRSARMLAQADVFVKYGLVERAVDHLRRVFALDPHHRGARERLASVLAQLGRRSEAAAELATLAGQLAEEDDADAALVAERALTLDPVVRRGGASCWARGRRAARARGGRRGAERRAARASWSRSTSSCSSRCTTRRASVLDELAAALPGQPAARREARGDRARRAGGDAPRGRRAGRDPAATAATPADDPARPGREAQRRRSAPIPAPTAISASPTSRWASTTPRSPSSSCCRPTGRARCSR